MQKYFIVARLAFLDILEYRFDFAIHAFKYAFFISMMTLVWLAVDAESQIKHFAPGSIIFYFLVAAIIYSLSNFHTTYIEDDIKLGHISKYLLKPVSPVTYYLIFQAVISFFELLVKLFFIIPIIFFLQHTISVEPISLFIFILFLPLIFVFSFLSYTMVSSLAYWLQDVYSIRLSVMFIYRMFSGIMIPIILFPPAVQKILFYFPIMHLAHSPIQILQNNYSLQTALMSFSILFVWTCIMWGMQTFLWHKGSREYEGNGI